MCEVSIDGTCVCVCVATSGTVANETFKDVEWLHSYEQASGNKYIGGNRSATVVSGRVRAVRVHD